MKALATNLKCSEIMSELGFHGNYVETKTLAGYTNYRYGDRLIG
jgi:hypothetical protein